MILRTSPLHSPLMGNRKFSHTAKSHDKCFKQSVTVYYALTQGITTGMNTAYSFYKATESFEWSTVLGVTAFCADFVSSYCFQGGSILETHTEDINIEENFDELPLKFIAKQHAYTNICSVAAQSIYTVLDGGKNFVNRYFLLSAVLDCLKLDMSPSSFYLILTSEFLLKQLFVMTNETYETVEQIAQKFKKNSEPFYHKTLQPLAYPIPRKILRVAGSLDHVLVDDLLASAPLFLSEDILTALTSSKPLIDIIVGLSAVVGIPLALSLFTVVYYFEGNHSEENLKKTHHDTKEQVPLHFSHSIINCFQFTIKVMPALHGLASGASVYYITEEITQNLSSKFALSMASGGFIFLGTTLGTYYSEAKEALKELEKCRIPIETSSGYSSLEEDLIA